MQCLTNTYRDYDQPQASSCSLVKMVSSLDQRMFKVCLLDVLP